MILLYTESESIHNKFLHIFGVAESKHPEFSDCHLLLRGISGLMNKQEKILGARNK